MELEGIHRSFGGREFTPQELSMIREVVDSCGLSRTELAKTVCELLGWKRPNGSLKGVECRKFLERLEACGFLSLPDSNPRRPFGSRTRVPVSEKGDPGNALVGSVEQFGSILLQAVGEPPQRLLFRELMGRYHYLGHTVPYGAHLRYLLYVSEPERTLVGALQFSSPAWRISVRDRWIGWDEATRTRNLQHVVQNSRFLIVPWVRIQNLASRILSVAARRLVVDWRDSYALEPLLLETLVDSERFGGVCYRAANWLALGLTTGRGRMDRLHRRHGRAPKRVLVYPLRAQAVERLRES